MAMTHLLATLLCLASQVASLELQQPMVLGEKAAELTVSYLWGYKPRCSPNLLTQGGSYCLERDRLTVLSSLRDT